MRTKPPCTNYKLSEERRTNTHQFLEYEYKARVGVGW